MDRWKAEQKSEEKVKAKRKLESEKAKEEKVRDCQKTGVQVREKVGKSQNIVFSCVFQQFVAREEGSPKRWVRSQLAR